MSYAIATGLCALGFSIVLPAFAQTRQAAEQVLRQTNEFRASEKLAPLAARPRLAQAAREFAQYMAKTGKYGHNADGRQPAERAAAHGYEYCIVSENIARVYRSSGYDAQSLATAMVQGWKNSPEHRRNMLDPALTEIGIGIAADEDGRYFGVQLFGRPKSAVSRFSVRNDAAREVEYRAGERRFRLPPRTERTHAVCRPPAVTIELAKSFHARPKNGARFVVVEREGELRVQ